MNRGIETLRSLIREIIVTGGTAHVHSVDQLQCDSDRRAVTCLVVSDDGMVLAVSRKDDPTDFGMPGGKVDPGETLEQAAARELEEETGLRATRLVPVFTWSDVDGFVTTTFVCDVIGSICTKEAGVVRWVKPLVLTQGRFARYNGRLLASLGWDHTQYVLDSCTIIRGINTTVPQGRKINIFILNSDPRAAARDLCNKHVCKMIVESAQLLSNIGHASEQRCGPYRPTHMRHPCTLWATTSAANAAWLFEHADELRNEYGRRYGRTHASSNVIDWAKKTLQLTDWRDHTAFVQAMPEKYRCDDAVAAYRAYYAGEKRLMARWAPRASAPEWWPFLDEEK